jgi:hypothetical protein
MQFKFTNSKQLARDVRIGDAFVAGLLHVNQIYYVAVTYVMWFYQNYI